MKTEDVDHQEPKWAPVTRINDLFAMFTVTPRLYTIRLKAINVCPFENISVGVDVNSINQKYNQGTYS